MDLGFDVVVTITGIVLVFLILILLMAIITLEGKIFDSMNAKKKAAKEAAKAPAVQPAAPVQQAAAAPAPQVEEGCTQGSRCKAGRTCSAGCCSCSCGGRGHPRRCGRCHYGCDPRNGQRQVHPQGRAPQQERLGQCGCKREYPFVLKLRLNKRRTRWKF